MIKIRDLAFEYFDRDEEGNLTDMINAIRGINFDARKGEFIGVCGKNGSGKSTFARILNRLLVPIEGTVVIGGRDALDEDNILDIRKTVGMVFQNPDDQLIGSVVAEDVAFGAENLGVAQEELWDRVINAVEQAGLVAYDAGADGVEKYVDRRINELSGGEKQKVAIAGVLAMKPQCIVLDESTSMLDPRSRLEIIKTMKELNEKLGITIIMITHMMEELLYADTIYLLHQGKLVAKGRKESIFSKDSKLFDYGLDYPEIVKIREILLENNVIRDKSLFTVEGIVERIKKEHPYSFELNVKMPLPMAEHRRIDPVNAILVDKLTCGYGKKKVLEDISFSVGKGEYVAVVGATGTGKSTLLQHIPALLKPLSGTVYVDGIDVNDRTTDIQALRCKIGYVFQYASQQLFGKNVYEDVVFGPRNVGVSEVEAEKRAYEAIKLVGLPDDIYDMPINKLSGGQKKRVALAGVLAMKPEYLILDEPTSGLDPVGKKEMLDIIDALHREAGITIIMVTHDVETIADRADRLIVLEGGKLSYDGDVAMGFYKQWYDSYIGGKDKVNGETAKEPVMRYTPDIATMANLPVVMQLLISLRLAGMPVDCVETAMTKGVENIINCIR
ncbi:MAG: ATP-binding cassette domain-containing protein [Lachnospiraceae bacterium]|nr:ATP-binding cassette domain-containing protein [Lachnospiraceae bacterium]